MAIYIIIIIVLIGALYAGFANRNDAKKSVGQAVQKTSPTLSDSVKKTTDTTTSAPATPPAAAPATTPTTPTPTAPAPAPAANDLANTGPGETAALFVVTVVVASLGFSLYQRRALA